MKKVYIVPNAITAFSLACGLFVIFKVNMIEPGMGTYGSLISSTIFLLLAMFADWADGSIARLMRAESTFGIFFDSLADGVTFGVAPSVVMLKSLSLEPATPLSFFALTSAMLFSICGILRLVRFNLTKVEEIGRGEKTLDKKDKHFTGMPIPAAALAFMSVNLFLNYPVFSSWLPLSLPVDTIILSCVALLLGYCMISRFKFPSAKVLHFRVPSFYLVLFAVLVALFVLYGVLYFFPLTLFAATWGYFIFAWTLIVIRLIAGKKSKTLEDFEPEDED